MKNSSTVTPVQPTAELYPHLLSLKVADVSFSLFVIKAITPANFCQSHLIYVSLIYASALNIQRAYTVGYAGALQCCRVAFILASSVSVSLCNYTTKCYLGGGVLGHCVLLPQC